MREFRTIRQHDTRDCGAASLCMICSFFGKKYTIPQLRKLTNTSQEGVSVWGMVLAAEKLGIKAEGFFGGVCDLREYMRENLNPLVLHLTNNHFVVAYKGRNKCVHIKDPARGCYRLSWKELERIWSGYLITFDKKENVSGEVILEESNEKYRVIGELIKENRRGLLLVFFLSVFIFAITICSNYVFQVLIDHGGNLSTEHEHENENIIIHFLEFISGNNIYALFIYMIFFLIVMSVMVGIRGKCVAIMSRNMDLRLVKRYINKISKASLHDISSRRTGEYLTRISDLTSLRRIISDILVAVSLDFIMVVASVFILVKMNKVLFFISLGGVFLYVLVAVVLKERIKIVNYKVMNDNASMHSFFKELIQGMEVIKANNKNESIVERFVEKYTNYADSVYYGNLLGVAGSTLTTLIEQVSNVVVVILGFVFVEAGSISLGELFSFYLFLSCLTQPIKDILSFQPTFQSGMASLERLEDIRFMEEERTGGKEIEEGKIELDVQEVCFHYPGKPALLQEVSFHVTGWDKVVLQGENSSGKSTLVKLIMGMEKVEEGSIRVNGLDIKEVDLMDLRKNISYVAQNNFLFADTLRNNITFGDMNYSQEDLDYACEQAGLQKMIEEMPMGYDTYIYENGGNMSMGQRQAVALARALIRKPRLLILDEATSNMDEERERNVIENIAKLPIPCIIISHSSNVTNYFDNKVVLGSIT